MFYKKNSNICNSGNSWNICLIERIPKVSASSDSARFWDIRVITVIHMHSVAAALWRLVERVSKCDWALIWDEIEWEQF